MPYPDGLATHNFFLPSDLAREMAHEGYEYSCYARTKATRHVFDSFVKDRVNGIYKEPCMDNVICYIDQEHSNFNATHAITISSSTAFQNWDLGTIFLRYNTPASQRINTPPFFSVMLIQVSKDERRKGLGSMLMHLAKNLATDMACNDTAVREDLSVDQKYAYHMVAFLPLKDDDEPNTGMFEIRKAFFEKLGFAAIQEGSEGCNFGLDAEIEVIYQLKIDLSGLFAPSPPPSPVGCSKNKRVRFCSEGDEEITAKLARVSPAPALVPAPETESDE